MNNHHLSRRRFLRNVAIAAPASSLLMIDPAMAQDLPVLSADDPMAQGLQYVPNASDSTADNYQEGQNCANCNFIQGNEGDEYRPCQLFVGKAVSANGWCISWVPKA